MESKVTSLINPVSSVQERASIDLAQPKIGNIANETGANSTSELPTSPVVRSDLIEASVELTDIVNAVSETSLSFSIEEELSRMVVAVRAVGSDEIIRQFPPEEFITVAKFISAQSEDVVNDDFLKGILFDQYS